MEDEIKDTMIYCRKDKEIKFNLPFKVILGISIFLTGLLTLGGVGFVCTSISHSLWNILGMKLFLGTMLFYISVVICFISLISIAVTKKPFSRILVWCIMAIGILFIAVSLILPRTPGYGTTGFKMYYFGEYTLFDAIYFIIGLLAILFSLIIHYGLIYQKNTDMTV